jgi:hypothetical protein
MAQLYDPPDTTAAELLVELGADAVASVVEVVFVPEDEVPVDDELDAVVEVAAETEAAVVVWSLPEISWATTTPITTDAAVAEAATTLDSHRTLTMAIRLLSIPLCLSKSDGSLCWGMSVPLFLEMLYPRRPIRRR